MHARIYLWQEEVEIEAKVVGEKAKLTSVLIEIRKKENGEVIGLGKQWTASNNYAGRGSELWTALNGNHNASSARSKLWSSNLTTIKKKLKKKWF